MTPLIAFCTRWPCHLDSLCQRVLCTVSSSWLFIMPT